ncbi:murein biosynthesis integral membrane protein MurJ [Amorphus sp. 3PC139-8]|uniref:murein biosynthesis integral membrane protein MurJ n=1 Tax=Amorphus sp. 3PC139-8 TaxID=2735676 RepID=UPI00345C699B
MNLLRNFATVGSFTMMSRVLGFARDILIAAFLGTGGVADAFFVAFKLPNLFRRLFAEGAFNSAFVPLFARALEEGGEPRARQFAEQILSALLVAVLALTLLAEIFTPILVWIIAPGFSGEDAEKFAVTVALTRICFPYLAAMSLVAFLSGVLNTFDKFAAAAFAPVLLNIVLIAVLTGIGLSGVAGSVSAGWVLSWGVFAAGLIQAGMLWVAVARHGFRLRLSRPRWNTAVKRLLKLGVPGVIAGGITQINIMVGTIIASFAPGAVSFLYYADRIYQLPLGVVGIAIGVALLPDLSRRLRSGDLDGAQHTQNRALEFSLVLTLPAAIALVLIPTDIIAVLFQRGAFDAADTAATAHALAAYGLGLPAFVLIKVLSPAFFAREDTATPMWFAGANMLVSVVAAIALFPLLSHVGIALATSLGAWMNVALLWTTLVRRGDYRTDPLVRRRLPRIALSSVLMGAVVIALAWLLQPAFDHDTLAIRALALVGLVGIGMVVFFGLCQLTGAIDLKRSIGQIRGRRSTAGGS